MVPINNVQSKENTEQSSAGEACPLELSVVMPCLNEAETLATRLRKCQAALDTHKIAGEIIVADNGSTEGSQTIATELGAYVVNVAVKGYGSALMGGITVARGTYIIRLFAKFDTAGELVQHRDQGRCMLLRVLSPIHCSDQEVMDVSAPTTRPSCS